MTDHNAKNIEQALTGPLHSWSRITCHS